MNPRSLTSPLIAALVFTAPAAFGVIVATDNFESNTTSGGTGWSAGWSIANGNFVSGSSMIDGTYSLGLYGGTDGNNASASRALSPSITGTGTVVTLSWSMRANWNIAGSWNDIYSQMGVNVLEANGDVLSTFKFVEGNSALQVNDGNADFANTGITFTQGGIFDFTFSSAIGSTQYSFTVNKRGSDQSFTATNYNFSGSRDTDTFGGLSFFVAAPGGGGNDGFIDSVSVSAVPEPASALAGLLVGIGLLTRSRKR